MSNTTCDPSFSIPAVVGITIGGVVGAETILALSIFFLVKLRTRSERRARIRDPNRPADVVGIDVPDREKDVKSPVGSLMGRWLQREGATRYSPVELGGIVEEEVPLQHRAYPSRVIHSQRYRRNPPKLIPQPVPLVVLPPQPPVPLPPAPPPPPANLSFYAPALAAALAVPSAPTSVGHSSATLYDPPSLPAPPVPPLPLSHSSHRPALTPLHIPSSSPPKTRTAAAPAPAPRPRLLPRVVADPAGAMPSPPPFVQGLEPAHRYTAVTVVH
ncbi:hypothetical protein JCM6882_008124 [Rhodosporidiobolus microsporus]